jgi:ribonuclease M5
MENKMEIKEVIVVEGRDDETAVKQAVKAEVIITHGFGIKASTLNRIKKAQETCGVIVLTDPDYIGEQIRSRIEKFVPGVKHAYIKRSLAKKDDNIGVENARAEVIIESLKKAHATESFQTDEYTQEDMVYYRLTLCEESSVRRDALGDILGIGYGNSKTFLKRLNKYGIKRETFEEAILRLEQK